MSYVPRLNDDLRSQITRAVIRHAYKDRAQQHMDEQYALFVELYHLQFSPYEVRAMREMQEVFDDPYALSKVKSRSVNAAGMSIKIGKLNDRYCECKVQALADNSIYEGLPVPESCRGTTPSSRQIELAADHPLCGRVQALATAREDLKKEIETRTKEVAASLSLYRTFRQLQEAWPEVWPIAKEFVPAEPEKPQLPAHMPLLNAALRLPPNELQEAA